jgi:glycosyltransferase involved in cell wall biosynthesis
MKVSVIIPAYNAAKTIDASIRSVLNQSLSPFEILALDDGSSDDTFARLQAYQPLVNVFRTSNKGLSNARNYLCSRARGDVMAFLDADDVWHPRYLQTQTLMLTANRRAVASFTRYLVFRDGSTPNWPAGLGDFSS